MKLFLIDGHALVFKMYYAFLGRPMVNSKGVDTSILFGFTKYLLELIEKEKPTHLAVSFDPPGGTFRNRLYPAYKANRVETPQLVIDALEPLIRIVKALDIPVLMIPDYEADDVIGSAAKRFKAEGFDVYMVTHDKDYGQLVEDHILQLRPGKAGENEILDSSAICQKWGIQNPLQVIDILTLCGDSADNIPGVQGVGPVGAAKLLAKYGSVENIYGHIDELTARQQELFRAAGDHIALSKELVTIKTDIPLDVTAQDLILDCALTPQVKEIFEEFEFRSLLKKVPAAAGASAAAQIAGESGSAAAADGRTAPVIPDLGTALTPEDFLKEGAAKVALALMEGVLYVCDGSRISSGQASAFKKMLEDPGTVKTGSGLKALINELARQGIELKGPLEDVELMHYLLNPERNHQTEQLARSYLGLELEDAAQKAPMSLFDEAQGPADDAIFRQVQALWFLSSCIGKELEESGMMKLYRDIEEPLVRVLSSMELAGVRIDAASLKDFADGLRTRMLEQEEKVRQIAGDPGLNVSSPKQMGEVIFGKLKLDPKAKKPKSGSWPTDEQTLLELEDSTGIVNALLEFRGTKKLLSTYIEPLPGYMSPMDGRVHTTFNQTLTSTGRLSSSNPNLQNIPVRTEEGREIRKAFVPQREGWVMMSADYSQIELRIMAHLCADDHMISAFRAGEDVHAATAAKIFGKPLAEVTADDRRVAKTANFGIMYGISAFGLAQRLGCSRSEAKKIIEDYFNSFPSIRSFIDGTLQQARSDGYVQTLFGRRRYVPDVNSHNANIRSFAERNAVNAPIQGTAADIIKLAMNSVHARLLRENLQARMVLQIHDELLLEVPPEEIDRVRGILVEEMENVIKLSVPLTVECNYGKTWLEAH